MTYPLMKTEKTTKGQLRDLFHDLAVKAEDAADYVRAKFADDDPPAIRIAGFAGYRTHNSARIKGRVLLDQPERAAARNDWQRFRAMLSLYNSREVADIPVRCEGYGISADAVSDAEGYFSFELPVGDALPAETLWEQVTLSAPQHCVPTRAVSVPVLAPGTDSKWGVISDIDDTILETGATDFLKNWRRVLIDQADERVAVAGAADLYGEMAHDFEKPSRPFFYVSSSPWNLYPMLESFKQLNAIPAGPMFLKDYGLDDTKFIHAGHGEHKNAAIDTILTAYPQHRFLLIGDSGQHDIDIYRKAAKAAPDRIGAVLIRNVTEAPITGEKTAALQDIEAMGIAVHYGDDFSDAKHILERLGLDAPRDIAKAGGLEPE